MLAHSATDLSAFAWLAPLEMDGMIRVGGNADGGYVLPATLVEQTDVLVSMGLGFDWQFEQQFLALRPSVRIDVYDHTVSRRRFRRHLTLGILALLTGKVGLAEVRSRHRIVTAYDRLFGRDARHHLQRIHDVIRSPVDVDIATVFSRAGTGRKFVKMDIEGACYRVLPHLLEHAPEIVGMAIEFHDTGPLRPVFVRTIEAIQREFEIVHLHANNFVPLSADGFPDAVEITFANRKYVTGDRRRTALPIEGLDRPNDPSAPEHLLRF